MNRPGNTYFAAAATIPCDKNDLAEALAERLMRDASSDVVEQTKEEAKIAAWDIYRPTIIDPSPNPQQQRVNPQWKLYYCSPISL